MTKGPDVTWTPSQVETMGIAQPSGSMVETSAAGLEQAALPVTGDGVDLTAGVTTSGRGLTGGPSTFGAQLDRENELQAKEHASEVARMRQILPLGMVLWVSFFFVDFVVATWIAPGDLWVYARLRALGLIPLALIYWRLSRTPIVTPNKLRVLDLAMQCTTAGILSVFCLYSGGIESPFACYIALVLMGRGAILPDHYRRGLVQLGLPVLLYPIILGIAAAFRPDIAAQFRDPHALGLFAFYMMLIVGAYSILVLAGHAVWALRRQVFEARNIGKYRLQKRIGRGGMGEVWIAFHQALRRDVALKILRPDFGQDQTAVGRFEREVQATTELSHPNTVRIFDFGVTDDGLWYYAMELLEGEDLAAVVDREGPLPLSRAVHFVLQAARALAEAHGRGIVHRDIKPQNLFVATVGGEHDFIKVLDFGIAKVSGPQDSKLTQTGWIGGTPMFISPEAAAGLSVEAPADVYALGAVLYFALCGRPPFETDGAMQMLFAHMNDAPQPPSKKLGRPIPADVEAVVMRCLEKKPLERFGTAGAFVRALEACNVPEWWPEDEFSGPSEVITG